MPDLGKGRTILGFGFMLSLVFLCAVLFSGEPASAADFDGDARADIAVWRPSNGEWWIRRSNDGTTVLPLPGWGSLGDIPVPGDYDGDNMTDVAIWRPSNGQWWIQRSSNAQTMLVPWGSPTDIPVAGDYDGDNMTDVAIWRPSNGEWWIQRSSDAQTLIVPWGSPTDIPVPGDYDGDYRTDVAIWRPSTGQWWIRRSIDNATVLPVPAWGSPTDIPVPEDYDSDGKTDVAIWRPSSGQWWIRGSIDNNTLLPLPAWGSPTDIPVPGEYDGDGKTDVAIWRPSTGQWWIRGSIDNATVLPLPAWGSPGDLPLKGKIGRFAQKDMTGTWDFIEFVTGINPGWYHGSATVDDTGAGTWSSVVGPNGSATFSATNWTVFGNGAVLKSNNSSFHGFMSSDKQVVGGVQGTDAGANKQLFVLRKRDAAVTYSIADVINRTFSDHLLFSGSDNTWEHTSGSINGSGVISLGNSIGPSGLVEGPRPNIGTAQISSTGIVTLSTDTTFYGIMTPDKRAIIRINTADPGTGKYAFGVILFTGEKVWTTADLARTIRYFGLRSSGGGVNPGWSVGTMVFDASGNGIHSYYLDSGGVTSWPNTTRTITSSGETSDPADSTYHGQIAVGYSAKTNTWNGRYGISFSVE